MAIALDDHVNSGNSAFSVNSIAVTFGATPSDGEVIYLSAVSIGATAMGARTWPSGFTELVYQVFHGGGVEHELAVARKVASGESGATYTLGIGNTVGTLMMTGLRWTGVDTTTPEDVTGSGHNSSFGLTDDVPSITTVTDNAVHIIFAAPAIGDQVSITAVGYATAQEMSADSRRATALYKTITPAGGTGIVTVVFTNADICNDFSLALRPITTPPVNPDILFLRR